MTALSPGPCNWRRREPSEASGQRYIDMTGPCDHPPETLQKIAQYVYRCGACGERLKARDVGLSPRQLGVNPRQKRTNPRWVRYQEMLERGGRPKKKAAPKKKTAPPKRSKRADVVH
jgi:hypothetical protein